MKTHLEDSSKRLFWLRLGFVAVVLLGVITLLLMTNSEPVEAAPEITLHAGDKLFVTPEGCSLTVVNSTQLRARLGCEAFTATATSTPTETATATATSTLESGVLDSADDADGMLYFTSDVVSAPDAKIYRTIKPGKRLVVLATAGECKLQVVEETAVLVRIKCKALPATATPPATATRTRTPTRTSTRSPAQTNLWVGNYTTATLCFEVHGSGIGAKCWIEITPKEIGSFPPGTYTYEAKAWCGSLTDTVNFPAGKVTMNFGCSSGILSKVSKVSPEHSASDAFATPAR